MTRPNDTAIAPIAPGGRGSRRWLHHRPQVRDMVWVSRIASLVRSGQCPRLTLFVDAVDREGNVATVGGEVHVRR